MARGWSIAVAASCLLANTSVAIGQERAVDSGAGQFAMALARNDVPGGIVAPREDLVRGVARPWPPAAEPEREAFKRTIAQRVHVFNRSEAAFRAHEEGGVVHIRSSEEPAEVTDALSRRLQLDSRVSVTVLGLLRGHVVHAMRGSMPSEGFVFTGLMPSSDCSLETPILPREGSATAVELLDDLVRQVPGLVWLVTYAPDKVEQTMKVGVLCRDGSDILVDVFQ